MSRQTNTQGRVRMKEEKCKKRSACKAYRTRKGVFDTLNTQACPGKRTRKACPNDKKRRRENRAFHLTSNFFSVTMFKAHLYYYSYYYYIPWLTRNPPKNIMMMLICDRCSMMMMGKKTTKRIIICQPKIFVVPGQLNNPTEECVILDLLFN